MIPLLSIPLVAAVLVLAACGDDDRDTTESAATAAPEVVAETEPAVVETGAPPAGTDADTRPADSADDVAETDGADGEVAATEAAESEAGSEVDEPAPATEAVTLRADVWADNWFSLWVNGELVGEDSVPITTERSFNAESFTFEATLPLTVAVEAKDFKENDTGLEYIGTDRQQMGDGGLIVQIVAVETGQVVAVTDGSWQALVTHVAPLDASCEKSADPDADCGFTTAEAPEGWTAVGFDASSWPVATVWTAADVDPKDGYDEIAWDASAQFVWGADLETDNTVLLRVSG